MHIEKNKKALIFKAFCFGRGRRIRTCFEVEISIVEQRALKFVLHFVLHFAGD
jgi:hypothetical protein